MRNQSGISGMISENGTVEHNSLKRGFVHPPHPHPCTSIGMIMHFVFVGYTYELLYLYLRIFVELVFFCKIIILIHMMGGSRFRKDVKVSQEDFFNFQPYVSEPGSNP